MRLLHFFPQLLKLLQKKLGALVALGGRGVLALLGLWLLLGLLLLRRWCLGGGLGELLLGRLEGLEKLLFRREVGGLEHGQHRPGAGPGSPLYNVLLDDGVEKIGKVERGVALLDSARGLVEAATGNQSFVHTATVNSRRDVRGEGLVSILVRLGVGIATSSSGNSLQRGLLITRRRQKNIGNKLAAERGGYQISGVALNGLKKLGRHGCHQLLAPNLRILLTGLGTDLVNLLQNLEVGGVAGREHCFRHALKEI